MKRLKNLRNIHKYTGQEIREVILNKLSGITALNNLILCFFILVKFILQYRMIASDYDLQRDEYLHLDQAHHLAWGFTSIPPVTSWFSWIILQLGNGEFWVKFFPALFGALTILLVWKSIESLKGGLFACILGTLAMLMSVNMRINTLYQPNSLDILCWTFVFYCVVRFIQSEKDKWLYWLAAGFAFGFLNKYNIGFLLVGLLPAVLLTEYRSLFRNRSFYRAMGIAFLLILPNLIWQVQNGLPVATHMQELSLQQLVNNSRIVFIKEQFLIFLPSFFLFIAVIVAFFLYKPFRPYRVIAFTYLFTISIFIYLRGKAYYAQGLYPILVAFGAVYLESLTVKGWTRSLRLVMPLFILATGIPFLMLINPVFSPDEMQTNQHIREIYQKSGQLRWEDGKEHLLPQDYADMIGWREMARMVDNVRLKLSSEEWEQTLVICDNYGQAGAVNYYAEEYPAAVSMSADYRNWFPGESKIIRNVLLVREHWNSDPEAYLPYFSSVELVGTIENQLARENGTTIHLLRNAYTPWNGVTFRQWISE
ncbi:glycosyltransferase family 39 protein [Parabacteroides goldsteinii]|uniref:glycosyltransferase family 39 protein n=1 Tax=Parabacteroides goldsteinii TaxID=328812 RepID=UPI0034A36E22